MVLKPGARALAFTAREQLALARVSFIWRARFAIIGPVSFQVLDRYDAGRGLLRVSVCGLPIQRKGGAQLARGEACRYLAELPWAPYAILTNRQLQWQQLDPRTVEVAALVADEPVAVKLIFDEAGNIAQTVALRPRAESGNALTPWIGEYRDYEAFGGIILPRRGEVRWELPEGPFTYWRATVTSFEEVTRH